MQITFDSNDELYDIEKTFAENFPEYEYTDDISGSNEEIMLSINRMQHPTSGDNWGRLWNEDTIRSEKYLVKKRDRMPPRTPNSTFHVLFGEELKEYKVDIRRVALKDTDRKGFLVVEETGVEGEKPKILTEILPDQTTAFWEGYRLLSPKIDTEFDIFLKEQKKRRKKKNKSI
ncbi:MAG TPA: hypothetical protein VNW95_09415 [Mucilaginibacter sp.]|nr:hypothetical protein [Mucilaginibacter sp.]